MVYFGGTGKWTALDDMLVLALQYYDESLCKGCHFPAWMSYNPKLEPYFGMDPSPPNCAACASIEESQKVKDAYEPGDKPRVVTDLHQMHAPKPHDHN